MTQETSGFSLKQMNQEQTMLQRMLIVLICKFARDTKRVTITQAECEELAKDFGAAEQGAALLQKFEGGVMTLEVVTEAEALLRMVDNAAEVKQAQQTEPLIAVVRH
jgi:hypothetical protein